MKKLAIALVAVGLVAFVISCGGGGGGGGGLSVTRDMMVGTWVMSTSGGSPCTGCVVLTLNASGSAVGTDTFGYFMGRAGTYKGTWEFAGGQLALRMTGFYDLSNVGMPSINVLHLSSGSNTNVYARQ